jgi:hypothetical protein
MIEFFLIVFRHVCQTMKLPIAILSQRLFAQIAVDCSVEQIAAVLQGWSSWPLALQEALSADCVMGMFPLAGLGEYAFAAWTDLASQSACTFRWSDRANRRSVAEHLANVLVDVVRAFRPMNAKRLIADIFEFPVVPSSLDTSLVILGMMVNEILKASGQRTVDLSTSACRACLVRIFDRLRAGADGSGKRDVLLCLSSLEDCVELLKLAAQEPVPSLPVPSALPKVASSFSSADASFHFKLLSWNIAGHSVSLQCPLDWSLADNMCAIVFEIGRWAADVIVLQECVSEAALAGMPVELCLVGAAPSHSGFVHVYAKSSLQARLVACKRAVVVVDLASPEAGDGALLRLVACHLPPGAAGAQQRQAVISEMKGLLSPRSLVVGDMNLREEETPEVSALLSMEDVEYAGKSQSLTLFFWEAVL